jgi:hypothetical protein
MVKELEARVGVEPTYKGFADLYVRPLKLPMLLGKIAADTALPAACPPELANLSAPDIGRPVLEALREKYGPKAGRDKFWDDFRVSVPE